MITSDVLRAAFLGLLQGLTEFLPVSSSGHLVLLPEILGWPAPGLTFDAVVHGGTALALLTFFRTEWFSLAAGGWQGLHHRAARQTPEWRMLLLLAIGTVPAVAAGLLLQDFFVRLFEEPRLVAAMLFVTGALLVAAERYGRSHEQREDIAPAGALAIGCAQAAAIIPGISRSGATIAAGQFYGLTRHHATRFSFMLAAPVTAAAAVLRVVVMLGQDDPGTNFLPLLVGFVVAFASGYWAIGWLLEYVQRAPLLVFAVYTWLLGLLALVLLR